MPTSSSDDELASRFSTFFPEKITRIRSKIDAAVVNRGFSVDFPLRFTKSLTFSHFRLVTEADVLRYMRETRKNMLFTSCINVSKLGEAYESAVPAVGAIINSSFDEGHFMAPEKRGLIRPYLKKIGLDINDLSNYHPVTNLTHLSKIIERAMLDQLIPLLEEVGVVPCYQFAHRKLHSTETVLCKIHDDLVSNTCHGKASLLVLLGLSAAFDTVDHQLLLSDFSDCGVEGTALSLLESYLKNRNNVWLWVNHDLNQQSFNMVSRRALLLVQYCSQFTLVHLLFSWKLMEVIITFLQMTLSCTSGLKILMKPNTGFHLSCLTRKSGWLDESLKFFIPLLYSITPWVLVILWIKC